MTAFDRYVYEFVKTFVLQKHSGKAAGIKPVYNRIQYVLRGSQCIKVHDFFYVPLIAVTARELVAGEQGSRLKSES